MSHPALTPAILGFRASELWKLLRRKLRDFLYQENGLTPLIRRMTGVCLIPATLFFFQGLIQEQPNVPTWRYEMQFLRLPPLSPMGFVLSSGVFLACGCALACGAKRKIWLVVPAILMVVLGAFEWMAFSHNWILLWLYTLALLFHREPRSCTRTLLRLAVSSCYLFAGLQKLHPEWLSGSTFHEILLNGWSVWPVFKPLFHSVAALPGIAPVLAVATVMVEFSLALALWFKRTRPLAFILGGLLHSAMGLFFDGSVAVFSITTLTGYLAFVDKSKAQLAQVTESNTIEMVAASALILMMFVMPLRVYVFSDVPWLYLSFADRLPWTWSMFLFREKIIDAHADYLNEEGRWQRCQQNTQASSNSQIYALADRMWRQYPSAVALSIRSEIMINNHWKIVKQCRVMKKGRKLYWQLSEDSWRDDSHWHGLARGSVAEPVPNILPSQVDDPK